LICLGYLSFDICCMYGALFAQ